MNPNTSKKRKGMPRLLAILAAGAVLCGCFALSARTLIASDGGSMFGSGGGDAIGSLPFAAGSPEGVAAPVSAPSIVLEGPTLAAIQAVVVDAYGEGYAQAFYSEEGRVRLELQGRVTLIVDRNIIGVSGVTVGLDVSQGFSSGLGILSLNQRILRTQVLPAAGDLEVPVKLLSESGVLDNGVMTLNSISVAQMHHRLDLSGSGGTIRMVSGY